MSLEHVIARGIYEYVACPDCEIDTGGYAEDTTYEFPLRGLDVRFVDYGSAYFCIMSYNEIRLGWSSRRLFKEALEARRKEEMRRKQNQINNKWSCHEQV